MQQTIEHARALLAHAQRIAVLTSGELMAPISSGRSRHAGSVRARP